MIIEFMWHIVVGVAALFLRVLKLREEIFVMIDSAFEYGIEAAKQIHELEMNC